MKRSGKQLEQLAATNRELEAFSYSVSHDLRAPLRALDGISLALMEDYTDRLDDTGQDYLRRIRSAAQMMGELIDHLLTLSRLTRTEMYFGDVDLTAMALKIVEELKSQDPRRNAQFIIDEGMTEVVDADLLRVAVTNLLGNAWKFTSKKPDARIEFGVAESEGNGFISSETTEPVSTHPMWKTFSSLSNACMAPANSPEPVSGSPRCTGSSPATAAGSGRRGLRTAERYFISPSVPIHPGRPVRYAGIGPRQRRCSMSDKTILLVEDNPDDELLVMRAFKKANVLNEVVVARDGAEALDYLFGTGAYAGRDVTEIPAVTLLDLKLPKIDGLGVLRRIREDNRLKNMAVVILTSSREQEDVVKSYELGANSYVRKPVDFNNFADAVRQLGLYWLVLNEIPPQQR